MTRSRHSALLTNGAFWGLTVLLFMWLFFFTFVFSLRWGWIANTHLHGVDNQIFWSGYFGAVISIIMAWIFYPSPVMVGVFHALCFAFPHLIFGMHLAQDYAPLVMATLFATVPALLTALRRLAEPEQ